VIDVTIIVFINNTLIGTIIVIIIIIIIVIIIIIIIIIISIFSLVRQLPGMVEERVSTLEECMRVIDRGNRNRVTAATGIHEHSSRSHSVIIVDVGMTINGCGSTGNRVDTAMHTGPVPYTVSRPFLILLCLAPPKTVCLRRRMAAVRTS
jgi:hypothetical protein